MPAISVNVMLYFININMKQHTVLDKKNETACYFLISRQV
jgi:hypothetical protein